MQIGQEATQKSSLAFLLLSLWLWLLAGWAQGGRADCVPSTGCNLALAYYVVHETPTSLTQIAALFQTTIDDIVLYSNLSSKNALQFNDTFVIPFKCACGGTLLGYNFSYTVISGDTGIGIAQQKYAYLSTVQWITNANGGDISALYPDNILKIPVNCSCGDPSVSTLYGLFATYVAQDGDNLIRLSKKFNLSGDLLQNYNSVDLNKLEPRISILFIPAKDQTGNYPPFNISALQESGSINIRAIVGGSVGGAVLLFILVVLGVSCFYFPKRHRRITTTTVDKRGIPSSGPNSSSAEIPGSQRAYFTESESSNPREGVVSPRGVDLPIDKSVQFSYEELASATDNFNPAKEIGRGGYGSVFYGEVRGQRLAIKMMNMQATREFLSELNVLTRVHHTNLVRLIGYCTVDSLFLAYEYVENGTLSQHLRASGKEGLSPLTWNARVQIALDAARGLEYLHEHTTPSYIHRDIKSSNILLDTDFRAKVSDFGLTKLTESGGASFTLPSRLVGTFGYMAPEYARFGDMSHKADVYSFGVVLFEILSAKEAVVHNVETHSGNSRGLVSLFAEALNDPDDEKKKFRALIDPALGDEYPIESAWKMAQLAAACAREEARLRPNMRAVVVALMTLSTPPQEWEVCSFSRHTNTKEHMLSSHKTQTTTITQ